MIPQVYLRKLRANSKITMASLAFQSGLKKGVIQDSENLGKEIDLSVFLMLEGFLDPFQN